MDAEKANQALYEKMSAEQAEYRGWLLTQTPEDILSHAYAYAIREDILMEMEELVLPEKEAAALLESATPLADVFEDFRNRDGHMDHVRECIEDLASGLLKSRREFTRIIPLYMETAAHAMENDEFELWQISQQTNIACKDAIELAISEGYDGMSLTADAKDILAEFGPERVSFVLAHTLQVKSYDARFSRNNVAWAILDFICEAAKTNRNNMGMVLRAMKFTASYLNASQLAEIKTDLGVFCPQTAHRHLIQPYTQCEINSALAVIDGHSQTPMRDRAIILLAFNSGLRCIDIRNLKLGDINWKARELRIVQSKTGKPIAVTLNGKTLNAIADYILKERPKCEDSSVFIRAYPPYTRIASTSPLDYMIDKYCRLAGIEKKRRRSFHSLRRAFGTELAEAEVPVTSISQMLGHSKISSGKAYLSFNRTQTALCSADFSEVPISKGIYADMMFQSRQSSEKGGDEI